MSITTMEELEALPTGTTIKVANRRLGNKMYTRSAGGFTVDGTEIEAAYFVGHVTAGQVTNYAHGDPETGDHFVAGRHRYIVIGVDDEVHLMQFHGDGWQSILHRPLTETRGFRWTRVAPADRPAWHDQAFALGTQMRSMQAENERLAAEVNSTVRDLRAAQRDLTRFRESRAAQVQVVVTGVTRLPLEKAAGEVPEKATVVDVVASWRREFTITTEPVSGCQCGTVTRAKVAEMLGIEESSDFGFQVDCGRH